MNNEISEEKIERIITPKKTQYFQNKLLFNQTRQTQNQNHFLNTYSNNIKQIKYNTIINCNLFNNNITKNNISLNYFKFNNKILREAIELNSYNHKKKDISILVKNKLNRKNRLRLLEKDIDLYSPQYKRLFSAQILDSKTKYFNQNKTYDRLIKNNLKKFLFSEPREKSKKIFEKALIVKKKNKEQNNKKNNNIFINDYFSPISKKNEMKMKYKAKKENKKRPNSNVIKYEMDKKYKMKHITEKNKKDIIKFKVNIVNFSIELNNISNKLEENIVNNIYNPRNIFYERIPPLAKFPATDRDYYFNKKVKEYKNKRINISLKNNEIIGKKNLFLKKQIID